MKSRLLLFFIVFCCECAGAQTIDTLRIYFQRGYSTLDLSIDHNRQILENFVARLQRVRADSLCQVTLLNIEGNTSPDGAHDANIRLSQKRAASVLRYLRNHTALPDSLIHCEADGIDWEGLAQCVEADPAVPARDEILAILHNTPIWIFDRQGKIIDGRKKQLMDLHGGVPYRYMEDHLFPQLRNSTIELHYCLTVNTTTVSESMPVDTFRIVSGQQDIQSEQMDGSLEPVCSGECVTTAEPVPLHRLALKTNLLYDAILMPSLEIEYRINDRWSVNLEGDVAWWSRGSTHKYYQIATISPEARYWFKTRKPWHGHYVGAFVGGSWYDLENGKRGYKGELGMVGMSYGYMFPVSRSISFEAGIGIGFLHTAYEEYLPIDGHYVYQQTSRTNYFGPVKLKFAFVWRLWNQNQKGGVR